MSARAEGQQRGKVTRQEFVRGVVVAGGAGLLALGFNRLEGWLSSIPTPAAPPTPFPGDRLPYQPAQPITPNQLARFAGKQVRVDLPSIYSLTTPEATQLINNKTQRIENVIMMDVDGIRCLVVAGDGVEPQALQQQMQSAGSIQGIVIPSDTFSRATTHTTTSLHGVSLNVLSISPRTQTL